MRLIGHRLRRSSILLNLSVLAEEAVAAALDGIFSAKLAADITQACRIHEVYLAEYGSLGDAIREERGAD